MNRPSITITDDYATLNAKNASFYYGWEETLCDECGRRNCTNEDHDGKEWCFVAKFGGEEIVIPDNKLTPSDTPEKLLEGIGWVLAKYELTEQP